MWNSSWRAFRPGPEVAWVLLLAGIMPLWTNAQDSQPGRAATWVDAVRGEPISLEDTLDDLTQARVIYLGEYHSIPRHHALETEILESLARAGKRLVLAMEQFDWSAQPALDRFNTKTIDLASLIPE